MLTPTPPHLRLLEQLPSFAGGGLAVAHDRSSTYLVVATTGRSGPCWVCAPVSSLAVDCVRDGRASPWSVVHHSATGTVSVFRTLLDGTIRDSVVLCADLPAGSALLSAA
jgi:hypothetical protein